MVGADEEADDHAPPADYLDDSLDNESDVYEDQAVVNEDVERDVNEEVNEYVEESTGEVRDMSTFTIRRSYWSYNRNCVITLMEGERDEEFDDFDFWRSHSFFASSNEDIEEDPSSSFDSSIEDLEENPSINLESSSEEPEEGPASKRLKEDLSPDNSEKLMESDESEVDEDLVL